MYYTLEDFQSSVKIAAFENESTDEFITPSLEVEGVPQDTEAHLKVRTVGTLELPLPAGTPKNSEVEVTFMYGEKGLDVYARLLPNGEIVSAHFQSASLKSPEEMEEARRRLNTLQTRAEA